MRALILSDVHANLEALTAVLAAAEGLFDQLWNLGDLVGYGGSPNAVVELLRPLETVVVRGNHDRVCSGGGSLQHFNPVARAAALWTREELTPDNRAWLEALPKGPVNPTEDLAAVPALCVHGSPLDEDQYILSMRDAWPSLNQMRQPITFFGHTHVQGGFAQRDQDWQELRPRYPVPEPTPPRPAPRLGLRKKLKTPAPPRAAPLPASIVNEAQTWTLELEPGTRHLINPGSVGQPRDGDWRAAFALFDTDAATVAFHRVPYDLVASQGRILLAGLPERLAIRLREGR